MKEFFALSAAVTAMRAYAVRLESCGDTIGAEYYRTHADTIEEMKMGARREFVNFLRKQEESNHIND